MISIGDYVVRKSYNKDILFKVTSVDKIIGANLRGITYRIMADAPLSDLEPAGGMRFTDQEVSAMQQIEDSVRAILIEHEQEEQGVPRLKKTGKVLHIDGDAFYLNLCLKYYEILGVDAIGENILEFQQPKRVKELIERYNPDILVLTGHDAIFKQQSNLKDIKSYRNSKYFINSVKEARSIRPTTDQLTIYAGACQSYFEAILAAGADYASSPERVLIHALDPPFIVERIAYCPFNKVLSIEDALRYTITSFKGMGGYEVLGKARKGGPISEYTYTEVESTSQSGSKKYANNKRNGRGSYGAWGNQKEIDRIRNEIGNTVPGSAYY